MLDLISSVLRVVVADKLGINKEKVIPESRLKKDLGAKRIDILELILEIENAFCIIIPDEEAQKIKTLDGLAVCVLRHQKYAGWLGIRW